MLGHANDECGVPLLQKGVAQTMKTHIWPEQVRFGTVRQVGRDLVFVEPQDGREGQSHWLYFSHLRSAEAAYGGIVFATGQKRSVHAGDKVAFVPRKDNLWLWALRDEYDLAATANLKTGALTSPEDSQSGADVSLDPELFQALGQKKIGEFYRRFPSRLSVV